MYLKSQKKPQILNIKLKKSKSCIKNQTNVKRIFKFPSSTLFAPEQIQDIHNFIFPSTTKASQKNIGPIYRRSLSKNLAISKKVPISPAVFPEPTRFCVTKDIKNFMFSISYSTKTGIQKNKIKNCNQDGLLVLSQSHQHLFAVFDGHGKEGHLISSFIQKNLEAAFKDTLKVPKSTNLEGFIVGYFEDYVKNLSSCLKTSYLNTINSGSTFLSVFLYKNVCVCTNLGDSKAILVSFDRVWSARQLNSLHKPCEKSEKARIVMSGGVIGQMKNEHGNPVGPLRVLSSSKSGPGIALTRSLGDFFFKEYGICDTPEISTFKLSPTDKCFIVATDGLWDYIDDNTAVDIVKKNWNFNNPGLVIEELMQSAYEKAGNGDIDDISVIVAFRE